MMLESEMPNAVKPAPVLSGTVTRRKFAAGIAWAVPVAAVVTPVPAYAASACLEVTVPKFTDQNWTFVNPNPATHVRHELGTKFLGVGREQRFYSRDNVLRRQPTATQSLSTIVILTAGCRYAISYEAIKVQNNGENQPDHTDQWADLYIGGTRLSGVTTGAATPEREALSSRSSTTMVSHFTPATTGPVELRFEFTLLGPTAPNFGNDDIGLWQPTITV